LKYLDNPHVSTVVELTEQLWQPIQTYSGSAKVEELNVPTFTALPYAFAVTQSWIKGRTYPRYNGKSCGLKPTSKP